MKLDFRGVPRNVPCENLRGNAHNNKDRDVFATALLVGSDPPSLGRARARFAAGPACPKILFLHFGASAGTRDLKARE